MTSSKIKMTIDAPLTCVWEVVTSLENYTWRSDISKLEVINDKQFVEIWHWIGNFTDHETYTEVEFIETVTAKKILMKPFIKMYLKKQQAIYCQDLKQAVKAAVKDKN